MQQWHEAFVSPWLHVELTAPLVDALVSPNHARPPSMSVASKLYLTTDPGRSSLPAQNQQRWRARPTRPLLQILLKRQVRLTIRQTLSHLTFGLQLAQVASILRV